jgi:hypothetical protein
MPNTDQEKTAAGKLKKPREPVKIPEVARNK